ncbi:MAG: tetratricopeptide repeat protein [Thermoanaerobaculia bacterium]
MDFLRSNLAEGGTGAIFGLRGMGGIGKTTLALKLANELKPRFPDAQIYLDLKGVDPQPLTAAQAMTHVVRSFHPESRLPESEAELAGMYRSVFEGKSTLLLMDNAARKEQVEPLIPPSTCLLLVTSRFRFTLPGLVDRDLDEMPQEDAKALLLKIAPRIKDAADEIARLCGRLPLALRLAASTLAERPDLSPSEYARRFKEGKERLEPVEASFKTSYELLSEERRRLWCMLAAFPQTFSAEAAAAVWDLEIDTARDHISELVRISLVEWEEKEGRYRLHDLARVFVDRRLQAITRDIAQRRHAQHFLQVLDQADKLYERGGEALRIGLHLFDTEWGNIQAGQAWAAARFQNDAGAKICSDYSCLGTYCLDIRQYPKDKICWRESALEASRHLGDKKSESSHLCNLGLAYAELGQPQRAIEFYELDLVIAREIGDRRGEGQTLGNLGLAYSDLGEIDRAIEIYKQDLAITREIGDKRGEGAALGNLGMAYADAGNPLLAIKLYEEHLAISQEIGDRQGEGHALGNLSRAYVDIGEIRRGIELYKKRIAISDEIGDRSGKAQDSWHLGQKLERLGDLTQAADLMQVWVDYQHEIGHSDAEIHAAQLEALRARLAEQKP